MPSNDPFMPLLKRDEVGPIFRGLHIQKDYRKTNITFNQCLQYSFILHNDVVNFWTHFIPTILWIAWLYRLSFSLDLRDPYWYPLVTVWLGSISYTALSSAAHLLSCMSVRWCQLLYMLDYHGITMSLAGLAFPYYYYNLCTHLVVHSHTHVKWIFAALVVALGILGTLGRCLTEIYNWNGRPLVYIPLYSMSLVTFAVRVLYYCNQQSAVCVYETDHLHLTAVALSVVMTLFFSWFDYEERFPPGTFDRYFHSHQVLHTVSAIMTTIQLYALTIDGRNRLELITLSSDHGYTMPSFNSVLVPFFMIGIIGVIIVTVLQSLLCTDVIEWRIEVESVDDMKSK